MYEVLVIWEVCVQVLGCFSIKYSFRLAGEISEGTQMLNEHEFRDSLF